MLNELKAAFARTFLLYPWTSIEHLTEILNINYIPSFYPIFVSWTVSSLSFQKAQSNLQLNGPVAS